MLTLKEWMELVDYKITEGSEYYQNGKVLYSFSSWNGDHDGWSFNLVFDPLDEQKVHMVEVCDYKNQRAYRLVDPVVRADDIDDEAWDDVKWVTLDEDDDFIQKALAIKADEDYDTRVSVPLDLPDDTLFELMKMAHERDLTLNQMVEEVLKMAISEAEKNPEKFKQEREIEPHGY